MGIIKGPYDVIIDPKSLETLSQSTERLGNSIFQTLRGVIKSAIINGALITDVDLDTTALRVEHKLGRKPLGYVVVKRDADSTVYEQDEEREDIFLNLVASAPVRVSLWVF